MTDPNTYTTDVSSDASVALLDDTGTEGSLRTLGNVHVSRASSDRIERPATEQASSAAALSTSQSVIERLGSRVQLGVPLTIMGEPFTCEVHEGTFYIRHRSWSLMGAGASLQDAYKDLFAEARDLSSVLREVPTRTLDQDALALRRFVYRFA